MKNIITILILLNILSISLFADDEIDKLLQRLEPIKQMANDEEAKELKRMERELKDANAARIKYNKKECISEIYRYSSSISASEKKSIEDFCSKGTRYNDKTAIGSYGDYKNRLLTKEEWIKRHKKAPEDSYYSEGYAYLFKKAGVVAGYFTKEEWIKIYKFNGNTNSCSIRHPYLGKMQECMYIFEEDMPAYIRQLKKILSEEEDEK